MFVQETVEKIVGVIKCVGLVLQRMCHLWKEKNQPAESQR